MEKYQNIVGSFASLDFRKISVAVVGDVCLDHYYFIDGSRSEISVETGLRTLSVSDSRYSLGGAGNVATTCRTLGSGRVDLYGVVGNDMEAMILRSLCEKEGIGTGGIVTQKTGWKTSMYHKVISEGKELPRYDLGNFNAIKKSTQKKLLAILEKNLVSYQCVILNEQLLTGLTDESFVEEVNGLIKDHPGIVWLADTRHYLGRYKGVVAKMNDREAKALCGSDNLGEAVTRLSLKWGKPVVVTLGRNGAFCADGKRTHRILGIDFTRKIDTVGAGDAFIASMAVALAGGMDIFSATEIGNLGASASVLVLFRTGNPSVADIRCVARDPMWRYNDALASHYGMVDVLPGSSVEIIDREKFSGVRGYPRVAIFDNDGTVSVLRQGWEKVMEECIVSFISGGKDVPAETAEQIVSAAARLIEKTTGIQTINQMEMVIPLVREFGLTRKILTAQQYKAVYLERLKDHMKEKLEALERGELVPEDLTIKGSVQFLRKLRAAGVRMYLASGTDQEDVVHEATLLGYADLFDGRIKGSVGDPDNDPKKLVVQGIIEDLKKSGIDPSSCAIFGDGPVEIREAHKNGFLAVGVLSDEKQRFGANMAKRERLILAGADVLIPDFSQIYHLYPEARA